MLARVAGRFRAKRLGVPWAVGIRRCRSALRLLSEASMISY